jgi:hypothetical protein
VIHAVAEVLGVIDDSDSSTPPRPTSKTNYRVEAEPGLLAERELEAWWLTSRSLPGHSSPSLRCRSVGSRALRLTLAVAEVDGPLGSPEAAAV